MFARYKRRRSGVYWYRTRRHTNPTRIEQGYVGKSRDLPKRRLCHEGKCSHKNHRAKDWMDLVSSYHSIRLPWWLGWDWITLSLETLVILLTRPRYNWQKNPYPGKVGPIGQTAQRRERDLWTPAYRAKVTAVRAGWRTLQVLGLLLIITGVGMTLWTNR